MKTNQDFMANHLQQLAFSRTRIMHAKIEYFVLEIIINDDDDAFSYDLWHFKYLPNMISYSQINFKMGANG